MNSNKNLNEIEFPSIFSLKVKPNAKKTEFLGFDNEINSYKLNIKEIPDNNKANIAIIKFFRKKFKMNVKIKSGHTSGKKIIQII